MKHLAIILIAVLIAGCATMPTTPPPLPSKKPNEIPSAALLPWETDAPESAAYAYGFLTQILEDRYVFDFLPRKEVKAVLGRHDLAEADMNDLSEKQLKAIAGDLQADRLLLGSYHVKRAWTIFGTRPNITCELKAFHSDKGKITETWSQASKINVFKVGAPSNADKATQHILNALTRDMMQNGN